MVYFFIEGFFLEFFFGGEGREGFGLRGLVWVFILSGVVCSVGLRLN